MPMSVQKKKKKRKKKPAVINIGRCTFHSKYLVLVAQYKGFGMKIICFIRDQVLKKKKNIDKRLGNYKICT